MFDSYRENTLRYYPERCINCLRCTQVCPHAVFAEGNPRVELAQPAECMECGACALNCPTQAIEVQADFARTMMQDYIAETGKLAELGARAMAEGFSFWKRETAKTPVGRAAHRAESGAEAETSKHSLAAE